MDCIAHRGFAAAAPENTVRALTDAAAVADAVEFDVRRCESGELVVVHDETVDHVTDSSGRVDEHSRAELAALDVRDSGEGVPTLGEVLAAIPETDVVVDVKESGLAADIADGLADHGGDVLVSAFDAGVLAEVAVVSDLSLALLVDGDREGRLDRALELDCRAIHPHWDLCEERYVSTARESGLAVNAWTIRDTVDAISARSAGVDGMIVDDPAFCDG